MNNILLEKLQSEMKIESEKVVLSLENIIREYIDNKEELS
jgi:hypothetical protein